MKVKLNKKGSSKHSPNQIKSKSKAILMDTTDWNEGSQALHGRSMTPAELIQQKTKLGQSREKIMKIESLQRKLTHIRNMIELCAKQDPSFKSVFIQQLFPMIRKQEKQHNEDGERHSRDQASRERSGRRGTMVIEMPRAGVDYFDPTVEALDENKIDKQVENLFKEYNRQKSAYRKAFKQSALLAQHADQL